MPDKPTTAEGYGPDFLERSRRTCLHVATVIGDMIDEVVLVGGLVPSLIVSQENLPTGAERHVGTMDVDMGLALGLLHEGRYQELSERLRRAGFGPDSNEEGRATRQRWVWKEALGVSIDFLIPPRAPEDQGGRIRNLEGDFAALIAPGLPLAFRDRLKLTLDGMTLLDERVVRDLWVCGPAAYLVLKALAFRSRGENKDAYDLYYVLRNHGEGPRSVADLFRPLLDDPVAREALVVLEQDFTTSDSVGAMRVAAFLSREQDMSLVADVAGFTREFLRLVKRE
jgi:hypothetical protein